MIKRDYYEILQVSRSADGVEIKKSYRSLAMECHPDRNKDNPEAEVKFKELCEAYEVLKDDQKRAAYDRYGHAAFENGRNGGGNPFDFGGFSDIFSEVFADFMGGGRSQQASYERDGDDLRYDVSVTLEEAYSGVEKEITFSTTKACETCNGHGTKNGKEAPVCAKCKGRGRTQINRGFMIMETICPDCRGSGRKVSEACKDCGGEGATRYKKDLKVKIPAGVDNGTRVRLAGEGAAGVRGGSVGDLYVFINVKEHKLYHRQGADLYVRMPISMACATLGDSMEIPSVDGRKVEVKIPSGTQTGQRVKIKGEGMPKIQSTDKGDLWVEFKVETPVNLSERQKELMAEFRSLGKEINCQPEEKGFFDKLKGLFG